MGGLYAACGWVLIELIWAWVCAGMGASGLPHAETTGYRWFFVGSGLFLALAILLIVGGPATADEEWDE